MSVAPYCPPWYPNKDPRHNPFSMNGETGSAAQTHYADWVDRIGDEALRLLIERHHELAAASS